MKTARKKSVKKPRRMEIYTKMIAGWIGRMDYECAKTWWVGDVEQYSPWNGEML